MSVIKSSSLKRLQLKKKNHWCASESRMRPKSNTLLTLESHCCCMCRSRKLYYERVWLPRTSVEVISSVLKYCSMKKIWILHRTYNLVVTKSQLDELERQEKGLMHLVNTSIGCRAHFHREYSKQRYKKITGIIVWKNRASTLQLKLNLVL